MDDDPDQPLPSTARPAAASTRTAMHVGQLSSTEVSEHRSTSDFELDGAAVAEWEALLGEVVRAAELPAAISDVRVVRRPSDGSSMLRIVHGLEMSQDAVRELGESLVHEANRRS